MDSKEATEVKTIINSLLVSNPLKMTVQKLWKDFYDMEGQPVPLKKFGFMSFEDYLRSIPDTVRVHGSGPHAELELIVSSKSEHINEMVLKQKKNSRNKHASKRRSNFFPKLRTHKFSSPTQHHFTTPKSFYDERNPNVEESPKNNVIPQWSLIQKPPQWLSTHQDLTNGAESNATVPKETLIVESQDYKLKVSVKNQINSIEDARVPKVSIESQEENLRVDYKSKVPVKVQVNLIKLVEKFPQGVKCTKLLAEYRNLFAKKLVYEDYGYRSVIQMCSDLPKIFSYLKNSSDDYLVYDTTKSTPSIVDEAASPIQSKRETVAKTHILEEVSIGWSSPLVPADVVTMDDEIFRYFPTDVAANDILDITVGEIYDLSKFWMYLTFGGLDELMEELHTFFLENHAAYVIPKALQAEGLYCVSLFASRYHRCVIVNMLPTRPHYVRVFFVDYGTVSNVTTESIWFLPRRFAEFPAQAMRARLSNIYPVYRNRPWPACAVAKFGKLIDNRVIVAKVTDIDTKDNTFEVYLADITDKDNVFYINDIFVKEGLALYTDEKQKPRLVDPNCIANVKYIHLYPEFNEIESGSAPITDEMKYITENKIPLHHFMPQYYDIFYNENIELIHSEYETRYGQTRIQEIAIPEKVEEEFDVSFYPESLQERMQELFEEKLGVKKRRNVRKSHSGTNGTTGYFCNLNRRSKLMNGSTESNGCASNSYQIEEILNNSGKSEEGSMTDGFHRLSLNQSASGTNPFLNNYNDRSNTNPFRSTNPFLFDLEETVSDTGLLEAYAKSSTEPQRVLNNLKDSHKCEPKLAKQVNTERFNLPDADSSTSTTTTTSENSLTVVRRVRTPPGFSSNNNISEGFGAAIPNCFSFAANNPYYQRMPFAQFGFIPPVPPISPLSPPLLESYYAFLGQMYPNVYSLGVPQFPFQRFGTPPRQP